MPSIEESVTELQAILARVIAEAEAIAGAGEALEQPRDQSQGAAEATARLAAEAQAAKSDLEELASATAALSYPEKAEQVAAARETVEQAQATLETIGDTLKEQAAHLQTVRDDLSELAGRLHTQQAMIERARQQLQSLANRSGRSGAPVAESVPAETTGASTAQQAAPQLPTAGVLQAASGYRATMGYTDSFNYKKTFFTAHPALQGKVVVHHAVEQQIKRRYPGLFKEGEIHSLENLRGIPKGAVNNQVHLSAIRKAWNKFYRKHPSPSRQEVLDFATEVDIEFGHQFNPPIDSGDEQQ